MKKQIFLIAFLAICVCTFCPAFAAPKTDVYIGITSVGDKHLPAIGMPGFQFETPQNQDAANLVRDVMRADLLFARYFDVNE